MEHLIEWTLTQRIWGCQVKYRLGLDIGTASVGLVALELDGNSRPVKPVHHSVRIFDEPLLPAKGGGVGETKKSARRVHRSQRKLHMRRARRLQRIAQLARPMGLDPKTIPADKGQRVHKLRAQAATVEIPLEDLLLVFLKMAKRCGYHGGFKVKKDSDAGMVETGIGKLKAEMKKAGCRTLGEYLLHRIQNGQHLRLKEEGLFAHRDMVEAEFNLIWDVQKEHHEALSGEHNGQPLREHFYKAIVLQRPLKSPAHMVGNCSLEPMLPRAPMAQPIVQAFRIEKQIADLRWGASSRAEHLSAQQKSVIREQLQAKKEMEFPALYKALEKAGCPRPQGRELNYAHGDRQAITGDRTAAAMKRMGLLDDWNALDAGHQISVINLLADMGSPEAFDNPQWAESLVGANNTPRKIKLEVKCFIDRMVDSGKFGRLSEMKFDGGRASYSIKALNKLVPVMREENLDERYAVDFAYPNSEKANPKLEKELPPHRSTGNTVIDVALGQVRREVNAAIKKLGAPPAEIIVELSRDMKIGLQKRGDINKKMRANEKRRKDAAKIIEGYTRKAATESQIRRYLLWHEQGEKYCPYCERHIILSDALNGNEVEYEHILPRSLTRIGKKRDFLVLAHKSCNQEKGNRTPWQAWGRNEARWSIIKHRAEQFEKGYKVTVDGKEQTFKHRGKARQLLVKDFEGEALSDDIIGNFTDRQFQETAWIAKACGTWLQSVCARGKISFSRGLLTAHLRRNWKLDTVIPEVRFEEELPVFDGDYRPNTNESSQQGCAVSKEDFDAYRAYWEGHHGDGVPRTHRRLNKRIDHRHHLVDALVIALTTRGLYQRMARHYKQVTDAGESNLRLYAEPGIKDIRDQALALVRECRPSHRPDRWLGGGFFKSNPSVVVEDGDEKFYAQRKTLVDFALDRGKVLPTDKVRKRLEGILPEETREQILKEFNARVGKGVDPRQALDNILHHKWNTPIRRVLVRGYKAEDSVLIKHGDPRRIQVKRKGGDANAKPSLHKYLEPDGYAYLEYTPGDSTVEPRLVRLHEAKPASSKTVRLYKKDTVQDSKDGQRYVIYKFSTRGPSLFLSPVTEAVSDIGKVSSKRKKEISSKQIAKRLILVKDERP